MEKLPRDTSLWIDRGVRLGELCKRLAERVRTARSKGRQALESARDAYDPPRHPRASSR